MLSLLKTFWKPALVGVVALAFVLGVFYVKAMRAENQRLAETVRLSQAALAQATYDLRANRLALERRQDENYRLAEEKREAITALEKVYENDEEACDWSAGVIPDGVYSRLCE
ncbi:MAG: hypothetical protein LBJ61_02480 [Deltaproteobacteria bacterium]|jgi:hypothetical protein|nr:hypothetical protein [Deltaproteobacteria bacterium]